MTASVAIAEPGSPGSFIIAETAGGICKSCERTWTVGIRLDSETAAPGTATTEIASPVVAAAAVVAGGPAHRPSGGLSSTGDSARREFAPSAGATVEMSIVVGPFAGKFPVGGVPDGVTG